MGIAMAAGRPGTDLGAGSGPPGRRVAVTGAAGFIGFHLVGALLDGGSAVLGLDDLNGYYDPALKEARLGRLVGRSGFAFARVDVADGDAVRRTLAAFGPTHVVHLAAQPGVRRSLEDPRAYTRANVDGFLSVLEACRHDPVAHLVYASSSSVYGANTKVPFSEDDRTDRPVSLYAATKRANELMAGTYAHLFGIPATGLRFFTVYGPWGRPDMAYYAFTRDILAGRAIDVFNGGRMSRDFTYVDDVVAAVLRVLDRPPVPDGEPPHRVVNIGSHEPVPLERFIDTIAEAAGRPAVKRYRPMQPGDVETTFADVRRLRDLVGVVPTTSLRDGIARFVAWFRTHHGDG